jgi:outer membrane protein assembly factor BamB
MRQILGVFLLATAIGQAAQAADWWQFRGPRGDGTAAATNLPERWGGFDDLAWRAEIPGRGWSSPVVVANRIWLTSAETLALPTNERDQKLAQGLYKDFQEQFQAHSAVTLLAIEIDAKTGEVLRNIELFTAEDPPPIHLTNSYASPTPVTDGARLYCHFGSLGTVALDTTSGQPLSGQVVWKERFPLDDITGPGGSPVLWNDNLIFACDGVDQQFVVALDKKTGQTLWKTPRPKIDGEGKHRRAFSTPLIVRHDGREQVVLPGAQWVCSYDPATGEELWRVNIGVGTHATIPRPVAHQGLVYVCTGYLKPQLWAIRLGGRGDVTESHVAWKHMKQVPEISSPIVVGEELYFVSSLGVLTCLDAKSGEQLWQKRIGGNYAASPIAADGKLYFTNQEGLTTVLRAGRAYDELARNQLIGQTMASPAIAGSSLLFRADRVLYCVGQP